jgi:SHAQKYF class myb-like DNA-binding protein
MIIVLIGRSGQGWQFITYIIDRNAIKLRGGGASVVGTVEQGGAPALHVRYGRFHSAIMQFGKDWRRVEQYVRTRTSSQVRSHAQKFFSKLQKTPEPSRELQQEGRHSETEFDL